MSEEIPPPPSGTDQPSWAKDDKASQEVKNWGRLEDIEKKKHRNKIWVLHNSGYIIIGLMWFFVCVLGITVVIWLIHFLTPWGWLTPDKLNMIQSVVISGGIGSFVTSLANDHMKTSEKG